MNPDHPLSSHSTPTDIDETAAWQSRAVIAELEASSSLPWPGLAKLLISTGFTSVLLDTDSSDNGLVSAAQHAGLTLMQRSDVESIPQATLLTDQFASIIKGDDITGERVWTAFESRRHQHGWCRFALANQSQVPRNALTLMLLASLPITPVITIDSSFLALPHDQSELVRSVLFWRNRFNIASLSPRLVHAGDDGMLLLITGTWLVALNWTAEEVSIDIGSTGSMWLMLATHRDVHLHGSLLILPRDSGAILANELAR